MVEKAGLDIADALHMASGVPAGILGLDDQLGSILTGRRASLTCLDQDLNAQAVVVGGTLV